MNFLCHSILIGLLIMGTTEVLSQIMVEPMTPDEETYDYGDDDYYDGELACLVNETKCPNEDFCFLNSQACDGLNDCGDGFDESNCTTTTAAEVTTHLTTTTTEDYNTYDEEDCDQFSCTSEGYVLCIPFTLLCDTYFDCDLGVDEENCTYNSSGIQSNSTTSPPMEIRNTEGRPETASTEPQSSGITTFTPRPSSNGAICVYENQRYEANTLIVSNNCTEISCSSSGRLLTWNNPDDQTCAAGSIHNKYWKLGLVIALISVFGTL